MKICHILGGLSIFSCMLLAGNHINNTYCYAKYVYMGADNATSFSSFPYLTTAAPAWSWSSSPRWRRCTYCPWRPPSMAEPEVDLCLHVSAIIPPYNRNPRDPLYPQNKWYALLTDSPQKTRSISDYFPRLGSYIVFWYFFRECRDHVMAWPGMVDLKCWWAICTWLGNLTYQVCVCMFPIFLTQYGASKHFDLCYIENRPSCVVRWEQLSS